MHAVQVVALPTEAARTYAQVAGVGESKQVRITVHVESYAGPVDPRRDSCRVALGVWPRPCLFCQALPVIAVVHRSLSLTLRDRSIIAAFGVAFCSMGLQTRSMVLTCVRVCSGAFCGWHW